MTLFSRSAFCVPLLLSGAASLAAQSVQPQPAAPVPGYTLAWSDEFDQGKLDATRWNYRTDSKHWSTQTPANVHVEGGNLVIDLKRAQATGKEYTGGGVISQRAFGHGYFESRFRIRAGKGWHSSFWMMKHDGSGGTNTAGADIELDAIENDSVNLNSYGVSTHRWKGEHLETGHRAVTTDSLAEFHVFGCEYTASEVRYFLDGRLVQTTGISSFPQGDLHIWLTSIASGLGNTDAVDESRLPGRVEYDYVRFYLPDAARAPAGRATDGPASPAAASANLSLNGEWLFTTDPQHEGESQRWFESAPESRWDRVAVPHCWSVDPRYPYVGPAWYRRHFSTPPAWAERHVRLRFEAVFYKSRTWVNGKLAGNHEGGYTPFELDVTRLLKPAGEDNLVVVEADNSWDTTTLPGARPGSSPELGVYPWWDFGGIVRDVTLLSSPPVYLARQNIQAVPDLKTGTATVKATVWLANTTSEPVEREVSIAISRETGGGALAGSSLSRTIRVAPFAEASTTLEVQLARADVALWHPDTPRLYRLRSTSGVDFREDLFGIRSIEIRGTQLLLNGDPIRMGGANRPADDPRFGLIEPDAVVDRDLRLMKEAGLELARIIHYAPAPALLDWADRHGMLLILESGNWQLAPQQMDSPSMRANWQNQMREMIQRDWNHPSVIAWSVGNEFPSNTLAGIRWVRDGRDFVRSIDPSRFVTFASNRAADPGNRRPADEASNDVDFVMLNTYAAGAQLGAALDRVHALWPGKPLLISEYGIRADGVTVHGAPTEGDALARQKQYFTDFFAAVRARPWVSGASLWTFNDYRSRYPGTNPDGYRWWGLVDPQRNKRPAYDWVRAELSPAVLGEARIVARAAAVELRTRADFPAYTLRQFRARWVWLDGSGKELKTTEEPLPDLPPGAVRQLQQPRPAQASAVRVEIVRPTGFTMTARRYDLN